MGTGGRNPNSFPGEGRGPDAKRSEARGPVAWEAKASDRPEPPTPRHGAPQALPQLGPGLRRGTLESPRRVILQLRLGQLEPDQRLEAGACHRLADLGLAQRIDRRVLVARLAATG